MHTCARDSSASSPRPSRLAAACLARATTSRHCAHTATTECRRRTYMVLLKATDNASIMLVWGPHPNKIQKGPDQHMDLHTWASTYGPPHMDLDTWTSINGPASRTWSLCLE
eukprot:359948-Chlamydomonas_euryale.AAC.6